VDGIVRHAEAAAEVGDADVVPCSAEFADQLADAGEGALKRFEDGEVAPDLDGDALDGVSG
jgi:hypothetical protein